MGEDCCQSGNNPSWVGSCGCVESEEMEHSHEEKKGKAVSKLVNVKEITNEEEYGCGSGCGCGH